MNFQNFSSQEFRNGIDFYLVNIHDRTKRQLQDTDSFSRGDVYILIKGKQQINNDIMKSQYKNFIIEAIDHYATEEKRYVEEKKII